MDDLEVQRVPRDGVQDSVEAFYDQHPYPPPFADLESYRLRWQEEARRRADFHLHWPTQPYRPDLDVLIAGCGTSQAARHALRQPASRVVGIDISTTSLHHSEALKKQFHLTNLEVYQLPIERVMELDRRFDKIVCTGVLHHLADPGAGLRALREVLKPDGVIHLMVYAAYGRAGFYMLQDYCRRLGIGHTGKEILDLAVTLTALPRNHPLARLLGESPDFQRRDALADALLNPRDRAYTVPHTLELIEQCGLRFSRWVHQAPYMPQCGGLANTPHAARLAELPVRDQYAAVELFRGNMLRHSLIVYHADRAGTHDLLGFDSDTWPDYLPIRQPDTILVKKRLPPGAAAVLINQAHGDSDLFLPVDDAELRLFEAIDGVRTIREIIQQIPMTGSNNREVRTEKGRQLFERLYWYDQVAIDASLASSSSQPGRQP